MVTSTKFVELETKRLRLKKFTLADAEDMFVNYCSSKTVCKYLTWSPHVTAEDTKKYIAELVLPRYESQNPYVWAITMKGKDEVIGSIDANNIRLRTQSAELGWCIGEKFWNKGYMSEAGIAVVNYLKEQGFTRIEACYAPENSASGRVMEKIGMSKEDLQRKSISNDKGEILDSIRYSIIF